MIKDLSSYHQLFWCYSNKCFLPNMENLNMTSQFVYKSTALPEALAIQKFNNLYLCLKYLMFVSKCSFVLILKADIPGHLMLKAIRS